jgi:membrane protease YdiL (CAAX protease family)
MVNNQLEAAAAIRTPRRFRYVIDIVVLLAITWLLDAAIETVVHVPINLQTGLIFDAIGKVLLVGVGCGLILLRGERLPDVGLKRPKSWFRTFVIGIAYAALAFIAIYLLEKAGFHRELSRFASVRGNFQLALVGAVYSFIGAGLYEEFMFRGFLMQALAMCVGGSRNAWIAACIVQAALFGASHAYQNPLGMVITGTLGLLLGILVLGSGRNLWPAIIGHGFYDASRFVLFYFQGPPTG